jgi:hypothetical protein
MGRFGGLAKRTSGFARHIGAGLCPLGCWQAGIQGGYSNMKLSSSQFTNGPSFGG